MVNLPKMQKNPESWNDPRVDELIEAQSRELDSEKRLGLIKEITEILQKEEIHFVPLA